MTRGPWLAVHKQIWCVDGGEIARLSVAGARWWSVAVRTEAGAGTDRTRLKTLIDAVATAGTPHSYGSWLADLCRDPSIRRAAA